MFLYLEIDDSFDAGGNMETYHNLTPKLCALTCHLLSCSMIEITTDGSTCSVYKGGYQYRLALPTNGILDANFDLYQQQNCKCNFQDLPPCSVCHHP